VRQHLALMAQLSDWLGGRGLAAGQLSPAVAGEFAVVMRERRTYLRSVRSLEPLLDWLAGQGVTGGQAAPAAAGGRARALAEYRGWLLGERGLAETTVAGFLVYAGEFLGLLGEPLGQAVAALGGGQVLGTLSAQLGAHPPRSAAYVVTAARSLLRWLDAAGKIPRPLAHVVPPASRRPARPPAPLPAGAVEAMLASCDLGTETGRRDYAVLVLLRRYGTRNVELARLEIADLRWRVGEIVLHGKGGRAGVLPLMHDAGDAVARYLAIRRPAPPGIRTVFLAAHAPVRPLHRQSVYGIVARACERAGCAPAGPRAFRHALGCGMLSAGAPLADIRDVLRHETITATAVYARADMTALAPLVRPWPGTPAREP
jgi:integrase/recombinase XerD